MNALPLKERQYHAFVSYSHQDYAAVSKIVIWLRKFAGINVWWDDTNLSVAAQIESSLPEGIANSRNGIIFISKAAATSGWMREEYGAILSQRTQYHEYSIITVKLDTTQPPDLLKTTKWIDIPNGELNEKNALDLLGSLYSAANVAMNFTKDIYVSRGWRASETPSSDKLCRHVIDAGFRLIGDSSDHQIFDEEGRISSIMHSCGGVLVIAPDRGSGTSPYIIKEIEIAQKLKIPYVLIAANENLLNDSLIASSVERRVFKIDNLLEDSNLRSELIDILRESYRVPTKPHYCFYASSLLKNIETNEYVKRLLEQVTGIKCFIGVQLEAQEAQKEIIRLISTSLFVLADISEGNNTLIEAGIARGAGVGLYVVCKGEPKAPIFMFRDLEVNFYQNGVEFLAIVHRIAFKFRRRIINAELQTNNWFGD